MSQRSENGVARRDSFKVYRALKLHGVGHNSLPAWLNLISKPRLNHTFIPWVMIIVGGAANNLGAALGASLFVILARVIDVFKFDLQPFIPFDVVWLNPIPLSLILVLTYRPDGIIPDRPTRTLPAD